MPCCHEEDGLDANGTGLEVSLSKPALPPRVAWHSVCESSFVDIHQPVRELKSGRFIPKRL
jgi:hypothetical protein